MADLDTESELGTEYVRGTRPPGATYGQTFSLSDIGQSLLLYQQGQWTQAGDPLGQAAAIASAASASQAAAVPIPEVVVTAPRPTPRPSPSPTPTRPPSSVYLPPAGADALNHSSALQQPQGAFLAPPPVIKPQVRTAPVKPAPRVARGLGILGLVPVWIALMEKLDDLSTEHWRRRLKPPRPPGVPLGESPPDPFRYGQPRPWGISGPPLPAPTRQPGVGGDYGRAVPLPGDDLETITVRAPARLPVPFGAPTLVPVADPLAYPSPDVGSPAPWMAPDPRVRPVPRPTDEPTPLHGPSLAPDPLTSPMPGTRPRPRTPTVPRVPSFLPNPSMVPEGAFSQPPPPASADPCDCEKKKPKKKNKKKDRTECFGGTFVERSRSLSKYRRYKVDCKTGKKIGESSRSSTTQPKKKTSNPIPPSWEIPPA